MLGQVSERSRTLYTWLCVGFITLLSFSTYVYNFSYPQAFFWDENYHVSSAQKYLNGVYFMEQHPPLGKLLIALGEAVYHPFGSAVNPVLRPAATLQNTFCCSVGKKDENGNATETPVNLASIGQRVVAGNTCDAATDSAGKPIGSSTYAAYLPTSSRAWACVSNPFPVNAKNDLFIGTDYARNPPKDFILTGYRLFPVLLAWLSAPLIFLIFLLLTKSLVRSTLFSFLYIFDNALVVHMRGAMLESSLIFFSSFTLLWFLLILQWKHTHKKFLWASLFFGLGFGLVMTAKVVGLILLLLVPFILWHLAPDWRKIRSFALLGSLGFLLAYVGVWHTHFSLGSKIVATNNDKGYYQASKEYRAILEKGSNGSLLSFPTMMRDSWHYVSHYNGGVPKLDLCKTDENGSPFFYWPLGARSISYRWETPNGKIYRYLYLQSNPVIWLAGLLGIVLATMLLLSRIFNRSEERLKNPSMLLLVFLLYGCYMLAISQLSRVMYLYHYFLPLLFSFLLFALAYEEIRQIFAWSFTPSRKTTILLAFSAVAFMSFTYYSPLTYYQPLSDEAFQERNILRLWDLRCVNCKRDNPLLTPRSKESSK